MVGSTYIHIKRNGRRTLLNIAQIASIHTSDIELASKAGQLEYSSKYSLEQGTLYTIQLMLTSRREMEYIFARADERDEVYDQLVTALAPAVVIESQAPFVPVMPEEPQEPEKPKEPREPSYPADLFGSQEEYILAMANAIDRIRQEKAQAAPQQLAPTPPTLTPPRKPYTRKPRE
jgi:hypothetical protein